MICAEQPRTLDGEPFAPGAQLRYWSHCAYDWKLQPHPCLADDQVATDSVGNATVVLGPWWARPRNATVANGVTWINMGAFELPYGLVLRQLLPAASFTGSAMAVPVGARPASYMGAYAPTVVACTKAQFQANLCASVAAH